MTKNPPEHQPASDEPSATIVVDAAVSKDGPTETTVVIPGYEILATLGQGGMGVIYRARQTDMLDREVALKTILSKHEDQIFRNYFLKEGLRQAQLHHRSILPIFTAGEAGEILYLSMYYARDGSLRDRINNKSLTIELSVTIICDVLAALHHAHEGLDAPLAHLDVKPENILFDGDNVFLADFGIARMLAEDVTVLGGVAGDPRYWPPEQPNNQATTKSDLYALGVMLYEMLAGKRPPDSLRIITSPAQTKALARELPAPARKFASPIARCLNPEPEARPSADSLRRELLKLATPQRANTRFMVAAMVTLLIGVTVSQPTVRETLQNAWGRAFPPDTYPMTFSIAPVNAELWLDGQEEALRSLRLSEGQHGVVAVAAGYVGQASVVEVEAGASDVAFQLDPIPKVSDEEFTLFINSFDGDRGANNLNWKDPTLQNLAALDQLEIDNPTLFNERVEELFALATAGDAVASTSLFYASFEGLDIPGGSKALVPGLIKASEEGYAVASLLRALYVLQSLFEAEQTFNDNPYAFEEVKVLLTRAAGQGLPSAAATTARVAGVGPLSQFSNPTQ